ncbi:M23 family metallopeptidase [Halobaculum sp. MBLA0147]|uniref:M23 family metallopeptidase n=1 Tax=Halobaculum sp. MBLA0147 TaxID=3079934 RepID=UPI00352648F4
MTDGTARARTTAVVSRAVDRLTAVNPMSLGLVGVVGLVGSDVFGVAAFEPLERFFLFFLWPLVGPVVRSVGARVGVVDPVRPRSWIQMGGGPLALVGMVTTFLNPLALRQDATQFFGSLVAAIRHRGSLPRPNSYRQSVSYRLPVEGTWTVANGSPRKQHSHSWFPATQRYAYDLVVTDEEGRTHDPDGEGLESYYCYDEPVLAPADGVVVAVGDGDPEWDGTSGLSHPCKRRVAGNYVTIRHADDEYSYLAHLVPGSPTVEPGDRVRRGEVVGRCGHTGNSSEPHLHFQLQDHPSFGLAAGLPVAFADCVVESPGPNLAEVGDWDAAAARGQYVHVGQRVRHDPDDGGDAADRTADELSDADESADYDETESDDRSDRDTPWVPGRGWSAVAVSVAEGLLVAGAATFLTTLVVTPSQTLLAGLLWAGGLLGLVVRRVRARRGLPVGPRESLGLIAGVWLVALVAALFGRLPALPTIGARTLAGAAMLSGVVLSVLVWEYARLRSGDGQSSFATTSAATE